MEQWGPWGSEDIALTSTAEQGASPLSLLEKESSCRAWLQPTCLLTQSWAREPYITGHPPLRPAPTWPHRR